MKQLFTTSICVISFLQAFALNTTDTLQVCIGSSAELCLPADVLSPEESVVWEFLNIDAEWDSIEDLPEGISSEANNDSSCLWVIIPNAGEYSFRALVGTNPAEPDTVHFHLEILPAFELSCQLESDICSGESIACELDADDVWSVLTIQTTSEQGDIVSYVTIPNDSMGFSVEYHNLNNFAISALSEELIVINSETSCIDTVLFDVTIHPIPEISEFTVNGISFIDGVGVCEGSEFVIGFASEVVDAQFTLEQQLPDGYMSQLASLESLNTSSVPNTLTSNAAGVSEVIYVITPHLTVNQALTCSGEPFEGTLLVGNPDGQFDIGSDLELCEGEELSLNYNSASNGYVTYEVDPFGENDEFGWSIDNGNLTVTNPLNSVSQITVYAIENLVFDEVNVCTGIAATTAQITGYASPEISLQTTPEHLCSGEELSIEVSSVQLGSVNYEIIPNDNLNLIGGGNSGVLPLNGLILENTGGNIQETLEISFEAEFEGCNAFSTVSIVVVNGVLLTASVDTLSLCSGSEFNLPLLPLDTNNVDITYQLFDTENITIDIDQYNNATGNIEGQFTNQTGEALAFWYDIVANYEGCQYEDLLVVVLQPNLSLSEVLPPTFCEGTPIEIELGLVNVVDGSSIEWSRVTNLAEPQLANGTGNITEDGIGINDAQLDIMYSVVSSLGDCVDSLDVFVTILSSPVINTPEGEEIEICEGENLQLEASDADSYFWSGADLSEYTIPNPLASPSETTTYIVFGDNEVCSDSVVVTVYIPPSIEELSSGTLEVEICAESTLVYPLINTSSGFTIEVVIGEVLPVQINDSLQITPLNSGPLEIRLNDTNGCFNEYSWLVDVIPNPVSEFSGAFEVCTGTSYASYQAPIQDATYSWTVSEGTIVSENPEASTIWVNWGEGDQGTITLVVTNAFDCISTTNETISIVQDNSPELEEVNIVSGGLLYIAEGYDYYQWGRESVINLEPDLSCLNTSYCFFAELDTLNFNYWVDYGNNDGCTSRAYYNSPFVGVNELEFPQTIRIYPNPSTGSTVVVHSEDEPIREIRIYDSRGRFIMTYLCNHQNACTLDVLQVVSGLYNVMVLLANGNWSRHQLIIR